MSALLRKRILDGLRIARIDFDGEAIADLVERIMRDPGSARRVQEIRKDGEIYMRRWFLSPAAKEMQAFLHNIAAPDSDPDPHDHPWDYISIILSGGYEEAIYSSSAVLRGVVRARPGEMRARAAEEFHRIIAVDPSTWTLFIRGARRRAWGYRTPAAWIDAEHYLGTRP